MDVGSSVAVGASVGGVVGSRVGSAAVSGALVAVAGITCPGSVVGAAQPETKNRKTSHKSNIFLITTLLHLIVAFA
jgi:hypothetical protein